MSQSNDPNLAPGQVRLSRAALGARGVIVDVRADQLVAGTATVPVSFWRLPEGVKVLKAGRAAAGEMPTVQLRMLPRPR